MKQQQQHQLRVIVVVSISGNSSLKHIRTAVRQSQLHRTGKYRRRDAQF